MTTIDTWLIGMAQHFGRAHRGKDVEDIVALIPYSAALGAVILARVIAESPRNLYVTGLLIFPFLWFNTLFFLAGAFPNVKAFRSLGRLRLAIGFGVLFAVGQIIIDWRILEYRPHMPVLMSGVCVYSVVFVPWLFQLLHIDLLFSWLIKVLRELRRRR